MRIEPQFHAPKGTETFPYFWLITFFIIFALSITSPFGATRAAFHLFKRVWVEFAWFISDQQSFWDGLKKPEKSSHNAIFSLFCLNNFFISFLTVPSYLSFLQKDKINIKTKRFCFQSFGRGPNWKPNVKSSTNIFHTVLTIVSPNCYWKPLVDYLLQLCCDHRIQNFPKVSNQQNMKIGLMSAVLIYFHLSPKKSQHRSHILSWCKEETPKICQLTFKKTPNSFFQVFDVVAW